MLRPLGHKVLVKPAVPDETTESGLILVQDRRDPEMSGEIVAVGNGPAAAHKVRTATIAKCLALIDEVADQVPAAALRKAAHDALAAYLMSQVQVSDVSVGDHVVFPYTAGQKLDVDGSTYLLMAEDDLSAVWTPDPVAA